jgi:hypothetical protein
MSPRSALIVLACKLTLLALLGCSRHDSKAARNVETAPHAGPALLERPAPPSAATPASAVTAENAADAGIRRRHRCKRDEDCLLSCTQGAVSADWYHTALPSGEQCQDGCASKGLAASCDSGRCVAKKNGVLVPECTELVKPVPLGKRAE